MKRFHAIIKETWWVWLILVGGGMVAGFWVSPIFFMALPISIFSFIYFAVMRYDDEGNPKVS
jgi:uncharacterized membrane protein YhaH (DUF805 family)